MPISQLLWVGRPRIFTIIRTADQVNNTTTFAEDNELGFYTFSGHTYFFEHGFHHRAEDFGLELRYKHTGDTTLFWCGAHGGIASADIPDDLTVRYDSTNTINSGTLVSTADSGANKATNSRYWVVWGELVVGTNDGIFVPEFRQSAGGSGDHRVFAGSWLRVKEIPP